MSTDRSSAGGAGRSSREHAAEAAFEWSGRFREGRLSRAERVEFVRWLRESPQNVAEYLRIAKTASALSEFRKWSELPSATTDEIDSMRAHENVRWLPGAARAASAADPASARRKRARRAGAIAAGALAATLAVVASGLWWLGVIGGTVYTTGAGELRNVKLNDGSELSLASETRLRVDFDSTSREIVLTRGEALFQVSKDRERPFIVHAGRTNARAVGTAFSVQRDAQHVVVTVGEGQVAVSQLAEARLPFRKPTTDAAVSLTADQQIAVSSGGQLEPVRSVDSQRVLAWAQGHLIFENETVDAVVARFNQFARVKLRVEDPRIGARTVSGIFQAHDPASFAAFIASVEPVTVTHTAPDEIVIGSAGSAEPADGTTR